jgi:epoxide hydrolase-like predicted phosphatase
MIKNVVFDLGGVVVGRDFDNLAKLAGDAFSFLAGHEFPAYWHDFDAGLYTREEVAQLLANDRQCSIEEAQEKIQNLLELLQEVPETREFIKELRAEGRRTFVLSNMSPEFYAHLKQFEVFNHFDGEVVSGYEHINKPDPRIYQILLDRYGLKAEESYFVDDLGLNIEAARECGLRAHQFTTTECLREELNKLGVL